MSFMLRNWIGKDGLIQTASICHQARTVSFYFQCERFCDPPQPACKKPTRTLGNHCFKTTSIQRNDVKIITPASAYCQRNNEEPFGVLVDSLGHCTYLRTKPKKQVIQCSQQRPQGAPSALSRETYNLMDVPKSTFTVDILNQRGQNMYIFGGQ